MPDDVPPEVLRELRRHGPILGKVTGDVRHYRSMTWSLLLKLRAWATEVAKAEGAHVYLVGSVLEKKRPRDIDIAVVWPLVEYERRFGTLPALDAPAAEWSAYLYQVANANSRCRLSIMDLGRVRYYFDLKFCPDTWWPDKDKLLLAESDLTKGSPQNLE